MSDGVRFDFSGKTVIVTGAERGIGLEIAQGFARCGANIVIAGIMDEEFPNAKGRVEENGVECTCIHTDVSNEEQVKALINKFSDLIKNNGTLEGVDEWGKRKLAYDINYESEGYYVLYNFESKPDFPAELERVISITDGVLRSMVVLRK